MTSDVADIETQRRLSGLSFAELSRRTHVPYQRLWRYFTSEAALSEEEMGRVRGVLCPSGVAGKSDLSTNAPVGQSGD